MSYDLVRNGITAILNAQGLIQSQSAFDFANASNQEYENTFILTCVSGEIDEPNSETMNKGLYDIQSWNVQIAFAESAQNDLANYDAIHRLKDTLIKEIDDPANCASYVRIQKYNKWSINKTDNYIVLSIDVKIIDTYTY